MTLEKLSSFLDVILAGDNQAPSGEALIAALEMAYIEIANKTNALKLLTEDPDLSIIRKGPGRTFVRIPKLPKDPTDELDIDSELVPAVARYIASYISKDKAGIHLGIANNIIIDYNAKVEAYVAYIQEQAEDDGVVEHA